MAYQQRPPQQQRPPMNGSGGWAQGGWGGGPGYPMPQRPPQRPPQPGGPPPGHMWHGRGPPPNQQQWRGPAAPPAGRGGSGWGAPAGNNRMAQQPQTLQPWQQTGWQSQSSIPSQLQGSVPQAVQNWKQAPAPKPAPAVPSRHSDRRDHRSTHDKTRRPPTKGNQKPDQSKPKGPIPFQETTQLINLRKKNDFLAQMKFKNTLPDVPFDPKLLNYPFDPLRFVKYVPTTLERTYKHEILVEKEGGVPIDLIDPTTYEHSEEDALDEVDKKLLEMPKAPISQNKIEHNDIPWLMRTFYLANDPGMKTFKYQVSKPILEEKSGQAAADELEEGEQILKRIEETFQMADETPVHPTKPDMKPEKIIPILPKLDLADFDRALVTFADDPLDDVQDPTSRESITNKGFMTAYTRPTESDPDGGRFWTYFLPKYKVRKKGASAEGSSRSATLHESGDYEWVREYMAKIQRTDRQFVWYVDEENDTVRYVEVPTKANFSKRKGFTGASDTVARPSKVLVTRKMYDTEEAQKQEEAMEEKSKSKKSKSKANGDSSSENSDGSAIAQLEASDED